MVTMMMMIEIYQRRCRSQICERRSVHRSVNGTSCDDDDGDGDDDDGAISKEVPFTDL